jgi:PEGA domain
MVRRGTGFVLVAAVLSAGLGLSRAHGAESDDDAEKLIRRGVQLRKAHDDEAAARAFQKAYDQVHSPRAAGQLGLAEQALGRWEDAERHVSEALRATEDAWVSKNQAALAGALGIIQGHLGRIEVTGDPEGAEVSINGRPAGKLPLADAVPVSAGEVDVDLRAPGYVPAQRTLTIVAGQYQRLVMHLAKENAGPVGASEQPKSVGGEGAGAGGTAVAPGLVMAQGSTKTSAAVEPVAPSTARTVVKWSAAGAAGLGLVVGVTATILHSRNVSAFDNNPSDCADDNGTAVLQSTGKPGPASCQSSLDAYRSDKTWAIVGYVGAGVFAATWLVLQLTEGSSPSAASAEHAWAMPLCAPSSSGLGLSCAARF